jgi:hypothetical protein
MPQESHFELSKTQRSIFLTQQLYPVSIAYQICGYAVINTALDIARFTRALQQVMRSHDAFQMDFTQAAHAYAFSVEEPADVSIDLINFTAENDPDLACLNWINNQSLIPLAGNNSLCRQYLLQATNSRYYWYSKISHLISDGYSMSLVFNQVADYYNELEATGTIATAPVYSYIDYIKSEQQYLRSPAFETDKSFWLSQLQGGEAGSTRQHS